MDERRKILEERFWAKVNKAGAVVRPELGHCWEWIAADNGKGYGMFGRYWRKPEYAHRISWEWANGTPVPPGMFVCHHCDNKRCVNPAHLYAGTANDNARDMIERGSIKNRNPPRGERNAHAKLSVKQVQAIEDRYFGGTGNRWIDCAGRIAAEFGVARTTVNNILLGKTWKVRDRKAAA